MSNHFILPTPKYFSFARTVRGHGWRHLPFEFDEATGTLSYAFSPALKSSPVAISITSDGAAIKVETSSKKAKPDEVLPVVRHLLRLDDDLEDFYSTLCTIEDFEWVREARAGRLLRSHTVFEDLVKTMCTTNCSWALTRNMTTNLVTKLGRSAAGGRSAFPTPEAMAGVGEQFYRDEIRAGYRSPYFLELAENVASGKLDPETWLTSELPTPELKKEIKTVKGIGDYAADNLLKLIGRYDGLALDSWLRAGFYKKHNREKTCADKKIEKHYSKFGKWKGLAMWCDLTRERLADIG